MMEATIDSADTIWQDIVENAPILAWIADEHGNLSWANRRWRHEIDADPVGRPWAGYIAERDRATIVGDWTARAQGQALFDYPVELNGPDGPRAVMLSLRRSEAGRGAWIGIVSDDAAQHRAETARAATRAELDTLTNAMPQMVWATQPDGHHDYYNDQWYRFTGMPYGSTDGEGWNGMFHPEDQDRAWQRWRHSLDTGDDYEIEYRLRHHSGAYRWVLGRALPVRGPDGTIQRWIGTCTDIDSAKRAAEQNEILSRELSHRIKNIFAVISGLVRMSARRIPTMRGFADELAGRIAALGAAHDLARPHSERSRPSIGDATLHNVLRELLSPYDDSQWEVAGTDAAIDDRGATPVALVFHELATNAAKYGALSMPGGRLIVRTTRIGNDLSIEWRETGGPAVVGVPDTTGFGTRLAALSVEQQLGGSIERDWRAEGLVVTIVLGLAALVRD
jgi:PAS domain S-box-containing protein